MRKLLPWLLIAIPVFYYFGLIVGAATYAGYSHITNYASELGAAEAPYPELFNVSAILAGIAALIAAPLMPARLVDLGGARLWSVLAAVATALWGVSMIMAGLFPMPNELHGAFGLGLASPLIPLFLLLAIRRIEGSIAMQVFLGLVFVASIAMFAIMFGVGELVRRSNVGFYQRLNSAATFPWLAIFGIWLLALDRRAADRSRG